MAQFSEAAALPPLRLLLGVSTGLRAVIGPATQLSEEVACPRAWSERLQALANSLASSPTLGGGGAQGHWLGSRAGAAGASGAEHIARGREW
eukprot:scaffold379_cov235-Pinguiococcus_pyrenoidosus.AAC.22